MKTLKNFFVKLRRTPIILGFADRQDVFNQFQEPEQADIVLCYANYEYGWYEGSATVFYYRKSTKKYYECYGSHCSCYGLEGQWSEEEIVIQEMINRLEKGYLSDGGSFKAAFEEFKKG
jgi:hypothetical protein